MLQTIFYILAIILMSLAILVLLGSVILVIYLFKAVNDGKKQAGEALEKLINTVSKPKTLLPGIGLFIAGNVLKRAKNILSRE